MNEDHVIDEVREMNNKKISADLQRHQYRVGSELVLSDSSL